MNNIELIRQLRTSSIQCDDMRLRDFGYLFKTAAEAIERLVAYNEFWEKAAITAKDIIVKELPKWIPVTERLPEKREWVLCACRANIFCVLKWDGVDWYENPTHIYMSGFVTHWMPLPEPPKEVSE